MRNVEHLLHDIHLVADAVDIAGDEQGGEPQARGRAGRLAAGVTGPDDDEVEDFGQSAHCVHGKRVPPSRRAWTP